MEAVLESLLFVVGDEGLLFEEAIKALEITEQEMNQVIEVLKKQEDLELSSTAMVKK